MLSKRLLLVVSCGMVGMTGGASAALAPSTAGQAVHLLVGTYHCVNHQSTGQTWRFTAINDVFGAWLRLHVTYPPQNGIAGDTATTFVGYDPGEKRWNIVGVDVDGSYFTRSSHSAAFNGSQWQDEYPQDGGRAVVRTFGSSRYTFDLTMPTAKGAPIQSHVVCTHA